jgi:hypothetical protein
MTMTIDHPPRSRGLFGLVMTVFADIAASVALFAIPLAAIGRLAGLWDWRTMIAATIYTVYAGIATIVLGLVAFAINRLQPWRSYRLAGAAVAFVAGVGIMTPVGITAFHAFSAPPIHDITTDTVNPPPFVALLAERAETHALNKPDYDPEIAPLQKAFDPDIKPKSLALSASEAFQHALDAAKAMGWRIAATDPATGRIEAVATTFWSGFNDDIVLRITAVSATESVVDMRSVSRVGHSDIGTNAARIRTYFARLS